MAAADQKLQALLELERRGALTPDTAEMLQAYRSQGVSKTKPLGPTGKAQASNPQQLELSSSRDKARAAMTLIDRVQPQLDRVKHLYAANMRGAGPLKSLREYLPSQSNAQFDGAVGALQTLVRPATRTQGEGDMSNFESKLALQMIPNRYNFDAKNEESLQSLQTFLDTNRASYSKQLGLPTPPPRKRKAPPKGAWAIEDAD